MSKDFVCILIKTLCEKQRTKRAKHTRHNSRQHYNITALEANQSRPGRQNQNDFQNKQATRQLVKIKDHSFHLGKRHACSHTQTTHTLIHTHTHTHAHTRRAARILDGRGPESGFQHQKGVRGVIPGNDLKNVHAVCVLYCICSIKIINLENFKILFFICFYLKKKIATV